MKWLSRWFGKKQPATDPQDSANIGLINAYNPFMLTALYYTEALTNVTRNEAPRFWKAENQPEPLPLLDSNGNPADDRHVHFISISDGCIVTFNQGHNPLHAVDKIIITNLLRDPSDMSLRVQDQLRALAPLGTITDQGVWRAKPEAERKVLELVLSMLDDYSEAGANLPADAFIHPLWNYARCISLATKAIADTIDDDGRMLRASYVMRVGRQYWHQDADTFDRRLYRLLADQPMPFYFMRNNLIAECYREGFDRLCRVATAMSYVELEEKLRFYEEWIYENKA